MAEPKRLDVDAIIEAKRQRMAAKGSAALNAAQEKTEAAAQDSARRAAAEQAAAAPRKERIHERLDREAEEKKRVAKLLAQVELVPIDDSAPIDEDPTEEEVHPVRARSSRRRPRSRSSRALRRSASTHKSTGGGGGMFVAVAAMAGIVVLGLLYAIMAT